MDLTRGLLLSAAVLLLAACSDFIEKTPLVTPTADTFFATEAQAVEATNATYAMLREWQVSVFSYIGMTDIVSDDADKGSTPNDATFLEEIDDFTFDASSGGPSVVWQGYYRGIYRANTAIRNVPGIEMDAAPQARLLAENKFLRAYFYFNLVRWFGPVVLTTEPLSPDDYERPRSPVEDVYAQIFQDLEEAAAVLPARSGYAAEDLGRATSGAALAVLAKARLTRQDWAGAREAAEEVIGSGEYALLPNYATLFLPEGEQSSESIFEVGAIALEIGGAGSQYNQVQGVRGTPNLGWGFNRPSDDLVAAYANNDPRRDATIFTVGEVLPDGSATIVGDPGIGDDQRYNQKAWVPEHPGGTDNGPGNIRLYRYADLLLVAAEAHNELGETDRALGLLNEVRARARGELPERFLPNATERDRAALRDAIWEERRVELAMEQQRWFDLVRQGRAAEVMRAAGKTNFRAGKHELFPIPQAEIDLSGGALTQNPGYE